MSLRISETVILLAIACGLLVGHGLGLQGPTTAFFALFAVLAVGYFLGLRLFVQTSPFMSLWWGSVASVSALMLLRGAWFYLGGHLDAWGDAWTTIGLLILAIPLLTLLPESTPHRTDTRHAEKFSTTIFELACVLVSIAAFILVARGALHGATSDAIRTPWPLLPQRTLPLIGLLWALVLACAWKFRRASLTAVQLACALGATLIIAPLLYRIGYGFDGFLHIAGERVLAATGTLLPKPPYYMGQYVFVTWLSRVFDLDIAFVDRWLVAISAMVLLPTAVWFVTRQHKTPMSLFAALVLIPISPLVATTPNGFATLLSVTALVLVLETRQTEIDLRQHYLAYVLPLLLSLWSTLTHPLIGLPVTLAIISSFFWNSVGWRRWSIGLPLAILAGISVPLVFGLASLGGSSASVQFDLAKILQGQSWGIFLMGLLPYVPNRYALWPEIAAWMQLLIPWIVLAFAVSSLIPRPDDETARDHRPASWLIASASTFIAACVLRLAGDFGFLIDYERGNYTDRLFMVATLLLLPIALPECARRLNATRRSVPTSVAATLVVVGLLGAGASYAALPRYDAVTSSRGWSVGNADLQAVRLIDEDANGAPYTVLADQSVSAAAVSTFGFKRYNGDVFFYPIPTGGALYDVFLRASYEDPSRDTMHEAAQLGGSDLVYFVVNDYWWKADQLSEAAGSSTDREFIIQDGKVKVFKYQLK